MGFAIVGADIKEIVVDVSIPFSSGWALQSVGGSPCGHDVHSVSIPFSSGWALQ